MPGAQDSAIYGDLFSDPEIAEHFSDAVQIRAMLEVEAALARVQARMDMIPADAAVAIVRAARDLVIEPADLAEPTYRSGVPVVDLVARLREASGKTAGQYVHWGATSQDVTDTATVLTLRLVLDILETRIETVIRRFSGLAERHRDTLMAARTRSQQAVPTTFGVKVCGWIALLLRQHRRLGEMRPRLLVAQLAGAAGTLAPFGRHGFEVSDGFADELGLARPGLPWHARRDGLAELAGWFALTTSSLAKIGQDLVLLAQSEVGEVRFAGGGSSTMPQKANPVLAETLVTLGRHNASLAGTMQHAVIHAHERDGSAWAIEWLSLPQMAVAAGAALGHAQTIAATLNVDEKRMRANLDASGGTILAEAASFALAAHMPRPAAQALVKRGCGECQEKGLTLIDWLRRESDAVVDWDVVGDPANWLGSAGDIVDRICADARTELAAPEVAEDED